MVPEDTFEKAGGEDYKLYFLNRHIIHFIMSFWEQE
jgi:hypothetical protein